MELPPLLPKIPPGRMGTWINHWCNMFIRFGHTRFRIRDKAPIPLEFCQVNFVERPDRYAFLKKCGCFWASIQVTDQVQNGRGADDRSVGKNISNYFTNWTGDDQGTVDYVLGWRSFSAKPIFTGLRDVVPWRTHRSKGTIKWNGVNAKAVYLLMILGTLFKPWYWGSIHGRKWSGHLINPLVCSVWKMKVTNRTADLVFSQCVNLRLPEVESITILLATIDVKYPVDGAK